jgi:predicted membrane channel-forming protein YqfA (hemolysin III family)
MASVSHFRFFRGFVVFVFAGAALLVGWYGLSLLVESFNGHGSPGGNILLFALGLILLVLSAVAFLVGVVRWTSSSPNPRDKNT